jgi:hypothetical protein
MKAGAGPGLDERAAIRQLPPPLAAILERATAVQIDERFADAREMAAELEPWTHAGLTMTGALVTELFGQELREEAQRLGSFAAQSGFHPLTAVSAAPPRAPS